MLKPSTCIWEDLPKDLSNWLQSQDGLKIDDLVLSTRRDLEDAFSLLHCHLEGLPFRSWAYPITYIAIVMAETYIHHVTKPPSKSLSTPRLVMSTTVPCRIYGPNGRKWALTSRCSEACLASQQSFSPIRV